MFDQVLKQIKPTEQDKKRIMEIADQVINRIANQGYKAILVGSVARDTFIMGDKVTDSKDIDIFVFFPKSTSREELEKKGIELGKNVLKEYKPIVHYAEHPYVKAKIKDIMVEVVPCYKVKEKIISAVDRSPLHNEYVIKTLKERQKDEVRLLKQFLKTANCYGADQRVHGFSGYLCELLVINYGSFVKLIEKAVKWDKKTIIDIEKKCKNYKKFIEPLIVIDPVDKDRNVAAAVSRKVLSKFIYHCRLFLETPSKDMFFAKKKTLNLKALIKGRNLVSVGFSYPSEVVEEIVWSQLERLGNQLKKQLELNEFTVLNWTHWTDEKDRCGLLFELNALKLSEYKKHRGPEIWDEKNTKAFIDKNPDYWFSRSVVCGWRKREHPKVESLLKALLEKKDSVPSHLQKPLQKAVIFVNEKTLKEKALLERYFTD